MPLGGLFCRLRALVVAGLVGRINVIRRPLLVLQVAVLNRLTGEKLQTNRKTLRQKPATQPQAGIRPEKERLTTGGNSFRL